jgi:hypothetical protein
MKWSKILGLGAFALCSLLGYRQANADAANPGIPAVKNEDAQQAEPKMPETQKNPAQQEILIPFANPAKDSDANTLAYIGATRLFGKGLEYLSKETGADKSAWGRAGELIIGFAGDSLAEAISHESSHKREIENSGGRGKLRIFPFIYGIFSGGEYYEAPNPGITPEQSARNCWAGLNQHALNADEISRRTRGQKTIIDSISYIGNTLVPGLKANGIGDGKDVSDGLAKMHMESGKKDLQRNTTIITLLNPALAESFYSLGDFIADGERVHKPVSAELASGCKIHLPHLSQYFTPNGAFAKAEISADIASLPVEIVFCRDLSFAQKDAALHAFQAGGRAYIDTGYFEVSPFAHLGRNEGRMSRAVGAGFRVPILDGIGIEATVSHSANDLIEQVKGNKNGWNGLAALAVSF